jgi:hypothetical protein
MNQTRRGWLISGCPVGTKNRACRRGVWSYSFSSHENANYSRSRMKNPRALYLVVRHRKNPQQPFQNIWLDDELLTSIQTTLEISELCRKEKEANYRVFIHRCSYEDCHEDCPPIICCSVNVMDVAEIGGWIIVEFGDQTLVNSVPTVQPIRHQNYYFAPSP